MKMLADSFDTSLEKCFPMTGSIATSDYGHEDIKTTREEKHTSCNAKALLGYLVLSSALYPIIPATASTRYVC